MSLFQSIRNGWRIFLRCRRAYYRADDNPIITWFKEKDYSFRDEKKMIHYCQAAVDMPVPVVSYDVWQAANYIYYQAGLAAHPLPSTVSGVSFGKKLSLIQILRSNAIVFLILISLFTIGTIFQPLRKILLIIWATAAVISIGLIMSPLIALKGISLLVNGRRLSLSQIMFPMFILIILLAGVSDRSLLPDMASLTSGFPLWLMMAIPIAILAPGLLLSWTLLCLGYDYAWRIIWDGKIEDVHHSS